MKRLITILSVLTFSIQAHAVVLTGAGTVSGTMSTPNQCQDIDAVEGTMMSVNQMANVACTQGSASSFEWGLAWPLGHTYYYLGTDATIPDKPYSWDEMNALVEQRNTDADPTNDIAAMFEVFGFEAIKSDNQLDFYGQDFIDQAKGETFVLGYLEYFNDSALGAVSNVNLRIETSSADPEFIEALNVSLSIVSTVNGGVDPLADADFLYFDDPAFARFGSFRVLEGESARIEILGSFNSLHLEGFGNVVAGNGFKNQSITAQLVSEPATILLLIGSLMLWARRKA